MTDKLNYQRIADYFSDLFGEKTEWEQYNAEGGTIILQENLSLKLITKIMDLERKFGVRVLNIRMKDGQVCVDLVGVLI